MGGCAASEGGQVEGPVTVYVSLPLTGSRGADGRDAADGARLALEQADGRAGGPEVEAEFLDDAKGKPWDPVAVGENARSAAEDSSSAAYIGELDSQPTRASLPITNGAGIVQVSPGAGALDLTGPAKAYEDSPDRYRPSGEATFARVIPDDGALAAAAAEVAADRGTIGVEERHPALGPYGDLMRAEIEDSAVEHGLEVVPPSDAEAVASLGESGEITVEDGGRTLLSPALEPANLADPSFKTDFESRFERPPGPYAAYGYEAMSLVLAAIAEAEDTDREFRRAVADAVLSAERPDSILGDYSIAEDGDSTLCAVQPYLGEGGSRSPQKPLCPSG